MRRKHWTGLAATLVLLASPAVAYANEPATDEYPFRPADRPVRERLAPEERLDEGRNSIQAAPGQNGKLVYSRAPYLEWPASTWTAEADGTSQSQLIAAGIGQGDTVPAWSPGGTMVAFSRDTTQSVDDLSDDIYLGNADGSNVRRLTSWPGAEWSPAWSPDGSRIAFAGNMSGNFEIYTIRIDGSDLRRMTYHPDPDLDPSWSPDGTRIAFTSTRAGGGNHEIFTIGVDGGDITRLTYNDALDITPTWSPSGTRIAFTSDRTGDFDIFAMWHTGADPVNLTNDPGSWDFAPAWSPDGSFIVYEGDPYGDWDILGIPAGGGTPDLLIYTLDDEFSVDWQPIPEFPLVDARFSMFESDIEWAFAAGITTGCSAERFCPDDSVTREQMASFLARALALPNATADYFTDDESSIHEADINRVAEAGITTGCGGTNYCPKVVVSREQMASFLARAYQLSNSTTDFFTDDESSIHEVDINRVAQAGITTGCSPTTYCPSQPVTRGQMAAFLHRAAD